MAGYSSRAADCTAVRTCASACDTLDARFEARHDTVVVHAAEGAALDGGEADGNVHVRRFVVHDRTAVRKREAAWHHADNRVGTAVQDDGSPDDRRLAREFSAPQRVAQNRDRLPPFVFFP